MGHLRACPGCTEAIAGEASKATSESHANSQQNIIGIDFTSRPGPQCFSFSGFVFDGVKFSMKAKVRPAQSFGPCERRAPRCSAAHLDGICIGWLPNALSRKTPPPHPERSLLSNVGRGMKPTPNAGHHEALYQFFPLEVELHGVVSASGRRS